MKKYIILIILSMFLLTSCQAIEIDIPKEVTELFNPEEEEETAKEDIEIIQTKEPAKTEEVNLDNYKKVETNEKLLNMENEMIDLVNRERESKGLNALEIDEELRNVARVKSNDIAHNDYFDHDSPTYGSPFDMMEQFGIGFTQAAENLAGHQSVKQAHEGLMNSEGHRENILREGLTHIGIGIAKDDKYRYIFTQMFITK